MSVGVSCAEKMNFYSQEQIQLFKSNLNQIAADNLNGCNNDTLLLAEPVLHLGAFTNNLPKVNILGSKGSGKTYLYKTMLAAGTWDKFLSIVGKQSCSMEEAFICPVVFSDESEKYTLMLDNLRRVFKRDISETNIQNQDRIQRFVGRGLTEDDWIHIWEESIWNLLGVYGWTNLDHYLQEMGKKIIFLFDGYEKMLFSKENVLEKNAIIALCKRTINHLYDYHLENIGMIVFLSREIAETAIKINFEQFRDQYQKFELIWEPEDSFKLALKLANHAAKKSNLFLAYDTIDFQPYKTVEEELCKIWGKRMGPDNSKNMVTSKWTRTALSDAKGQIPARDMVMFLKYATQEKDRGRKQYSDRIISPNLLKTAAKQTVSKRE